ncbi:putative ABC transporter F family member 1 [Paratrimastix pyriformis]|uniref:ABC transporter F family member 1 n=1 Tax=Paratrimastix pyriformis TaxID=342808 RepID=A0ABQ8UQK7_9EUKA|nr:putative ABC transporter F family member 1 [Paratrimastix pyriformis]
MATPSAKPKLVIKPFKNKPHLSATFEEDRWRSLHESVLAIQANKPIGYSEEELYRCVEDLCLNKLAPVTYQRLEQLCDAHIRNEIYSLLNKSPEPTEFLQLVSSCWQRHCKQMGNIRSIFLYLDRTYAVPTPRVIPLWELGLDFFRRYFNSSHCAEVKQKTINCALQLIEQERMREVIRRDLVKDVLSMLAALQLYELAFQEPFLEATARFYNIRAGQLINSTDIPDYLAKVEGFLYEEAERCEVYLQPDTRKALLSRVEARTLKQHIAAILERGFGSMMKEQRVDDLRRLYLLFARVGEHEALRKAWLTDIKARACATARPPSTPSLPRTTGGGGGIAADVRHERGKAMVADEQKDRTLIEELLQYRRGLLAILEQSFAKNERFEAALRDAFEFFVNTRKNRPAELVAKFIDKVLRSGNKTMTDEEMEDHLDQALILFRCISGKDVFEAFYKKDLAKRLLLGKSASIDAERSMISKLKAECGTQFTTKLESVELNTTHHPPPPTTAIKKNIVLHSAAFREASVDMYVHVLAEACWPTYPKMEITLPEEASRAQALFAQQYLEKHKTRRLVFQHSLGHCVLKCNLPTGLREADVSVFQATVLMLYNTQDRLPFAAIAQTTKIEPTELKRTLQSLTAVKLLLQAPERPAGACEEGDLFTLNLDFRPKHYRIKINQVQIKETPEENAATNKQVLEDRQYYVDSIIVRTMKARRTLPHNELVNEVFGGLRFPVNRSEIKKRIESLLDRQYISRDPKQPDIFHYVAAISGSFPGTCGEASVFLSAAQIFTTMSTDEVKQRIKEELTRMQQKYPSFKLYKRPPGVQFPIRFSVSYDLSSKIDLDPIKVQLTIPENYPNAFGVDFSLAADIPASVQQALEAALPPRLQEGRIASVEGVADWFARESNILKLLGPHLESYTTIGADCATNVRYTLRESTASLVMNVPAPIITTAAPVAPKAPEPAPAPAAEAKKKKPKKKKKPQPTDGELPPTDSEPDEEEMAREEAEEETRRAFRAARGGLGPRPAPAAPSTGGAAATRRERKQKKEADEAAAEAPDSANPSPAPSPSPRPAEDTSASLRSCTGVRHSHPLARDVKIGALTLTFHGKELLMDTSLELNMGQRYGLIGANGCGKSTLLKCIADHELPFPDHIDMFLLSGEMPASDKTALECVMEVDTERIRLEKVRLPLPAPRDGQPKAAISGFEMVFGQDLEEQHTDRIAGCGGNAPGATATATATAPSTAPAAAATPATGAAAAGPTELSEEQLALLDDIYHRLDQLDASKAQARAAAILHGLGFTTQMQHQAVKEFSGGWRMRIALARALFVRPTLLLLDEPTNHLDLEACVWLENYLRGYDRMLLLISHSQDFLNNVCTRIIHMYQQKLTVYGGNYDQYITTRSEKEEYQRKAHQWEQARPCPHAPCPMPPFPPIHVLQYGSSDGTSNEQIAQMKQYIARFGRGNAKLAAQAQSKAKTLAKMEAAGLTEAVTEERHLCGQLNPPLVQFHQVTFGYPIRFANQQAATAAASAATASGAAQPPALKMIFRQLDFAIEPGSRIALVGPNGCGKSTLLKLVKGDLNPIDGVISRNHHCIMAHYHQHLQDQLDENLSPIQFMMREYPNPGETQGSAEQTMRSAVGRYGLAGASQIKPIRSLSDGQKSRVVFAWLAFRQPHLLLLDEPTNHLDFRLIKQVAKEIYVCDHGTITKWRGTIQAYKQMLGERCTSE